MRGIADRYGTLGITNGTGAGVTIYVVDSGIRTTHHEFISETTGAQRADIGYYVLTCQRACIGIDLSCAVTVMHAHLRIDWEFGMPACRVDLIGNLTDPSPGQDCAHAAHVFSCITVPPPDVQLARALCGEGPAGDGHGTHVASIAVGRNVGVAKEANVVAVRVLDCQVIFAASQQ